MGCFTVWKVFSSRLQGIQREAGNLLNYFSQARFWDFWVLRHLAATSSIYKGKLPSIRLVFRTMEGGCLQGGFWQPNFWA